MAKRKHLLPFWVWPGAWGLQGKTKERAKAEYELTGEELDRALAKIDYAGRERKERLLEIELNYGHIDEYQYEHEKATLITDKKEREKELLEVEKKFSKITDHDYEKKLATLNEEPWVSIIKVDIDQTNTAYGALELDWNEYFVEKLESEGYVAPTEEQMVNLWLNELCKHIALEEFDGTGDFNEKLDNRGTHVKVTKIDDTRYSKE